MDDYSKIKELNKEIKHLDNKIYISIINRKF